MIEKNALAPWYQGSIASIIAAIGLHLAFYPSGSAPRVVARSQGILNNA